MADALKTVRIIANANNRALRTVNIVASTTKNTHKQHTQAAGVATKNTYETVQDSGGNIKGLPTIFVSGYVAPA